jgi:hypothetical protein
MKQHKSVLTQEYLFQEQVRIDTLNKQYELSMKELFAKNETFVNKKNELDSIIKQFNKEKREFLQEMKVLKKEITNQQNFLVQEQIIFEKKKGILENGFQVLADDKKRFEQEIQVNRMVQRRSEEEHEIQEYGSVQNFFNGVNNNLTLKKRYKDLLKIFHPDNISGDNTTIQLINEEYTSLKDEFQ